MVDTARSLGEPKLLFQATVERRPHRRRFWFSLLIIVAAIGAWYALDTVSKRGLVDSRLTDIGWLAAAAVVALMTIRAVISLIRWLTRKNETLRFYDQGFTWTRDGQKHKYAWSKLLTLREGGRGIYLGRRPLLQWGANTLTMSDQQVFKVTPRYGDLRRFARAVRPYAAEVTGTRMGRILRQDKAVRLHPKLTAWQGGVEAGKQYVPWAMLDISVKRNRLFVKAKDARGKFKAVRSYSVPSVDNVGGFVELATTTIRNHQRERFEKRAKKGRGSA